MNVLSNKTSLTEGDNLKITVEKTFSVSEAQDIHLLIVRWGRLREEDIGLTSITQLLFTQFAASGVPGNVYVDNVDGETSSITGQLTQYQTRIIFSTPAMIIVVTCLTILISALVALPWWIRSWEKTLIDLKREPDVLGAVLGYVCDSSRLMAMFQDPTFTKLSDIKAFLKVQVKISGLESSWMRMESYAT